MAKIRALIDLVYDGLGGRYVEDGYIAAREILTPLNVDVLKLNDAAIQAIPRESRQYVLADTVEDAPDTSTLPEEFLNSFNISGLPRHKLNLKVDAPIILLQNIKGKNAICNGTRLQVCHMLDHYIEAKWLTGILTGQVFVIPRIPLISHNSGLPFEIRRGPFPVQLTYAMTINKAQGQTLKGLDVYLPQPVFAHGQLYIALSRATSRQHIKIAVDYNFHQEEDGYFTLNDVYHGIAN
ncbi:LOW QUALITY PROTEIN: Helitron helicase [Phytophthora megakarya]|uniref:Helitron helicase n=1 Tax=Phytophthora megakarya TaxID=4795 RepID=A0A225WTE8_9STRA|nr:LOW QUALITY PROTEIN: Helitron helicase [Phytophthora megakarya]